MLLELSISVRLPLVCCNVLLIYCVFRKSRKSVSDILTGSFCILGTFHYLTTVVLFSFGLNYSVKDVDYMVIVMYCELLVIFFMDRYLATVYPLLYKVEITVKYAYVSVSLALSFTGLLFLVITLLVHDHVFRFNKFASARLLETIIFLSTIILLFCTFAISKALVNFFGRQMYIFRKSFQASKEEKYECNSQTREPDLIINKLAESSLSREIKDEVESPITFSNHPECSRSQKLSVPYQAYVSNEKRMALRQARYSCPLVFQSSQDIHEIIVASLKSEIKNQNAKSNKETFRNRSNTFSAFEFKDIEKGRFRGRSRSEQSFSMIHHSYNLIKFISDLRYLRTNSQSEKSASFSQSKHLIQILLTKFILHVASWLPFVVASFQLETLKIPRESIETFRAGALHVSICCHHVLPIIYAMTCKPYRTIIRHLFKQRAFNRRSGMRRTIRRRVQFSGNELDQF